MSQNTRKFLFSFQNWKLIFCYIDSIVGCLQTLYSAQVVHYIMRSIKYLSDWVDVTLLKVDNQNYGTSYTYTCVYVYIICHSVHILYSTNAEHLCVELLITVKLYNLSSSSTSFFPIFISGIWTVSRCSNSNKIKAIQLIYNHTNCHYYV